MALTNLNVATQNKAPTFMGAIERADEDMRMLELRVEQLANKLVGSVPLEVIDAEGTPSDGVFNTAYSIAARISSRSRSAISEIDRIERALP